MKNFQPIIKWSGSKRHQSKNIVEQFPKEIDTYYEPFCGGASVLRALIESDIKVNNYVCSDTNNDLISLWMMIKTNPQLVYKIYNRQWEELKSLNNMSDKKNYYEKVRERFNKTKNPLDFMFLNRTCFNGLIRYNQKGEFNSPFHLNRDGVKPETFKKIITEWSELINQNNVEFKIMAYHWIKPNDYDFMYLDPPYANTKGMYAQEFDNVKFFNWLKRQNCGWALSYDGKSGEDDHTFDVPKIYDEHFYLESGNSSFKRLTETDKNAKVFESLYLSSGTTGI